MKEIRFLDYSKFAPDDMEILGYVFTMAVDAAREAGLTSPWSIGTTEFVEGCAAIADKAVELYDTVDENGDFVINEFDYDRVFDLIEAELKTLYAKEEDYEAD